MFIRRLDPERTVLISRLSLKSESMTAGWTIWKVRISEMLWADVPTCRRTLSGIFSTARLLGTNMVTLFISSILLERSLLATIPKKEVKPASAAICSRLFTIRPSEIKPLPS